MSDMNEKCGLASKECGPCKGGVEPMGEAEARDYMAMISDEWELVDGVKIRREFKFKDFKGALEFTDRVGALAEEQQHHPGIFLTWGKVKVTLYTHKIGGLHRNDFVMAAKIDELAGGS